MNAGKLAILMQNAIENNINLNEINDAIEKFFQDSWISVNNELPEYGKLVLLLTEYGDQVIGSHDNLDGDCWRIGSPRISWDYDFNLDLENKITHWMYLPENKK